MAGYHLFSTGEVLTAANVNDYVMKQTVMVFASAAARTTALSGVLREGMISYRTDSHITEYYNGSAWATLGSVLTTKGDLATYDTAAARLAVGADGTTLVANSSAATGLSYQPLNSAGKNAIINGGMDIWQRGTSFSVTGFVADRWTLAIGGTATASQDSTSVPVGFRYSMKILTGAASSFGNLFTYLETATVIPLRGQVVTISWYMIKNATHSGSFGLANVYYSNTTDAAASQLTAVAVTGAGQVPTTSWARYSATFTVPSDAMGLSIQFNNGLAQASGAQLNLTGVQLELGSVATTFSRAGGTIQGELAACQRYYWRQSANSTNLYADFAFGTAVATTSVEYDLKCPVSMRITPTVLDYSLLSAHDGVTRVSITTASITALYSGVDNVRISSASTPLTQYRPYFIQGTNSASAYIGLSAEL